MKVVVQRVKSSSVTVEGRVVGRIGTGLCLLVGIGENDTEKIVDRMAGKCATLRIFEDDKGKMNLSLLDVQGEMLVISQFTLYGDTSSGHRPFFGSAARPEKAIPLYEHFVEKLKTFGRPVQTGVFGADMLVDIANDGPVTILMEEN